VPGAWGSPRQALTLPKAAAASCVFVLELLKIPYATGSHQLLEITTCPSPNRETVLKKSQI